MRLELRINFRTDGDFGFDDIETIIDTNSPFYNGATLGYIAVPPMDGEDLYIFILTAEGDPNGCRYAARDFMQGLVCRLRTTDIKYYLIPEIYDLVIGPKENLLWSGTDVHHGGNMSGNYDGTKIRLDIWHNY